MIISNIEISQFRNYSRFSTNLSPELNWIHGSNGQGKTNLVEAIHYLCNLESFRTRKISPIIQKNKQEAMIKAQVDHRQVKKYVRINISRKGRQVFIDNKTFDLYHKYKIYASNCRKYCMTNEQWNYLYKIGYINKKQYDLGE